MRKLNVWKGIAVSGWVGVVLLLFTLCSPGIFARPLLQEQAVSDADTHTKLDTANDWLEDIEGYVDQLENKADTRNTKLTSLNTKQSDTNTRLDTTNSHLVGIHNDLVGIDTKLSLLLLDTDQVLTDTSGLVIASSSLSNSMLYETRVITGTGVVTTPKEVVYARVYSSGDRQISILLVGLLILGVFQTVFAAARGLKP